jgi:uncharacterized membrane protein
MNENLLTAAEKEAIEAAIAHAELNTSGEIRVHIESNCKGAVLDRAAFLFNELKMQATELRNGVLFYIAIKDHQFAVIGDMGINSKVPSNFWDDIKVRMQQRFRAGHISEGLVEGIGMAGTQLGEHFPFHKNDTNEITNNISFGE